MTTTFAFADDMIENDGSTFRRAPLVLRIPSYRLYFDTEIDGDFQKNVFVCVLQSHTLTFRAYYLRYVYPDYARWHVPI